MSFLRSQVTAVVFSRCLRSLNPKGRLVIANPKFAQMLRAPITRLLGDKKVLFAFSQDNTADLEYVADLVESGTLKVVIDRRYPLEDVPDAHRYVETGAKIGQVVIDVVR